MVKFEDFIKTVDKDMRVEIYNNIGEFIYNGKLKDLKNFPESIIRLFPQYNSREVYLELVIN